MKRKKFIKKFSNILIASGFSPTILSCFGEEKNKINGLKNWAGNYKYKASEVRFPKTISELSKNLKGLSKVKALGTQHCFNDIADTSGVQLSTRHLNSVIELNEKDSYVIVESGIKYGDLGNYLHQRGWALHNLASLPHISVGGSCATATHGSGTSNGNMASALLGFELLIPSGDIIWVDTENNSELFYCSGVSMGALGIMTKIKLAVEPTYNVSQLVYENLPMDALKENFDLIMGSGYSVSFFTHWLDKNINQIWIKSRENNPFKITQDFFGARPALKDLHPIKINSPINCTPQMGLIGPWHERLPHFKMDFTPSNGDELQSEFFVARENAYDAIISIQSLYKKISPLLFVTEIRCVASDNFWMSTAYKRDSVAIHFTWKPNSKGVLSILPEIQKSLEPFKARPHWGKIFSLNPNELEKCYPKFKDFLKIKKQIDPKGVLNNKYLDRFLKIS